jgi:hypothetical protein
MWTSLAATVLLAGAAIGSRGWYGEWYSGGWGAGLQSGAFWCGSDNTTRPGWHTGATAWPGILSWAYRGSILDAPPRHWSLTISLWLPAGATFAVSALSAFKVYRTRRRPGHCPKCGYDRSGLPTDAPCPECGRKKRETTPARRPDPPRA